MAVTMQKIAELAHVSRGTVDRALNRRPGVDPEVAARIREIAKELGYVPGRAGRALSTRKRPVRLGLLLNSAGNPFYAEVLRGVHAARQSYADFNIELDIREVKGYDPATQLESLESLAEGGIQALVLTPINEQAVADRIDLLAQSGIPVVTLNSDIENTRRMCYVGCNYLASGQTAAGMLRLLAENGARVGIVTGSVRMLGHNQRIAGFRDGIRAYPDAQITVVDIAENNDDDETSYRVTRAMLEAHPEIDAVYFTAGGTAGGVRAIAELREDGYPTVITCDATPEIRGLVGAGKIHATICQQPYEQGFLAVKLLLDRVLFGQTPADDCCYMQNEIKIRENI